MIEHDVGKYLPHRPPFVFVDEFELSEDLMTCTGFHLYRPDEFFFKGHFPSFPVVPGVLLVEAMAQCGGAGVVKSGMYDLNGNFFLASIKSARFHKLVVPGDRFDMVVKTLRTKANFVVQHGVGSVNGEVAVEAEWMCAISKHINHADPKP